VKLDQIRWDSVAKVGAGVLLAVAIATSLPSLLSSEQPKPLEPDVGLPQAALPPPAPPRLPSPPKPKPKRNPKPKRRPKPKPHRQRDRQDATTPAPSVPVAAPVAPGPAPGSYQDFGFERP
jgi:periplasmic protein TonB